MRTRLVYRRAHGLDLASPLRAVLLALLLQRAVCGRSDPKDHTQAFVIRTDEDAWRAASLHATSNKEVMFTTVSFTHKGVYAGQMAEFATHLWQSLREVGRMENTIILSYDLHTCQGIMDRGIPCFVDRWSLQPSQLPGQYGKDVPHWYSKYSWALRLLEWNFTAVFVEMDQVFTGDPLAYQNPDDYDLQGLSDWGTPQIPDPKVRFTDTCGVYHTVKKETGVQTLDWGPGDPNNPRHTKHINPCMSTGFWIAQPTSAAKQYFRDFIQLAVFEFTDEVDQIMWNRVIMAYTIGTKDFKSLRVGLLDEAHFSNFYVFTQRVDQGLYSQPVMLHCGGLHGDQKFATLHKLGFWKGNWWDPAAGAAFLQKLSDNYPKETPHAARSQTKQAVRVTMVYAVQSSVSDRLKVVDPGVYSTLKDFRYFSSVYRARFNMGAARC